jgi:FtsH-binding integral membrane protein
MNEKEIQNENAKQVRINTFIAHYILLFPIGIGAILIYVKKPHEFPMVENRPLLFVGLLIFSLFTFWLGRFIRSRPEITPSTTRTLVLLQASLGECCAITGIVFYLLTGDPNLPWVFMILWLIHYGLTLRSLATRPGG